MENLKCKHDMFSWNMHIKSATPHQQNTQTKSLTNTSNTTDASGLFVVYHIGIAIMVSREPQIGIRHDIECVWALPVCVSMLMKCFFYSVCTNCSFNLNRTYEKIEKYLFTCSVQLRPFLLSLKLHAWNTIRMYRMLNWSWYFFVGIM